MFLLICFVHNFVDCNKTYFYDNTTSECAHCPQNMVVSNDVIGTNVSDCNCVTGYRQKSLGAASCVGKLKYIICYKSCWKKRNLHPEGEKESTRRYIKAHFEKRRSWNIILTKVKKCDVHRQQILYSNNNKMAFMLRPLTKGSNQNIHTNK